MTESLYVPYRSIKISKNWNLSNEKEKMTRGVIRLLFYRDLSQSEKLSERKPPLSTLNIFYQNSSISKDWIFFCRILAQFHSICDTDWRRSARFVPFCAWSLYISWYSQKFGLECQISQQRWWEMSLEKGWHGFQMEKYVFLWGEILYLI